ncbi:hypothetical protein [Arsenophonus endosymbiont of Aleurodicus floccissimus]|uniref:hypothetical protein n=1 Tax=Arsenophonus endosymbiont of Aleurodicus floccissimus TaxID=2152761 RepID=UPI000E6B432A|nr:hypothetical protein [Arsenophonus endosymbiont of Aleurodicus floccissimus]
MRQLQGDNQMRLCLLYRGNFSRQLFIPGGHNSIWRHGVNKMRGLFFHRIKPLFCIAECAAGNRILTTILSWI